MREALARVTPSWAKLRTFAALNIFDRFAAYNLALIGFIFGLRVRLIGEGEQLVALIQGTYLVAAAAILIASVVIWKLDELFLYSTIPQDVNEQTSVAKYLEQVKKGTFDDAHFKAIYSERVDHWNKENSGADTVYCRSIIVILGVISVALYLLSFAFFVLSCRVFLAEVWKGLFVVPAVG